jgi:hypothetical protein
MDRPGTCIILAKKYNIANSSWHLRSYGSIWTGPSPKKYYMDLRNFGPYNIFWVTDRSIYCQKRGNPVPVHITLYWPAALTKTNRENKNVKYNIWIYYTLRLYYPYLSLLASRQFNSTQTFKHNFLWLFFLVGGFVLIVIYLSYCNIFIK